MKLYFTKTPRIISKLFSNYTWYFYTDKKEIYLTFDDGPTEVTSFVLNQLQKHQAKATFFCVGQNIQKKLAIFNRILKEQHSVGNHTYNHLNGWKTKSDLYIKNVLRAEEVMRNNTSTQDKKLFRPPYGKIKKSQAKKLHQLGYKIVMWSVLSADFDAKISKESCLQNVLKNTQKGSIIVFHDSVKAKKNIMYALPKVLEYFSKRGYVFKTI